MLPYLFYLITEHLPFETRRQNVLRRVENLVEIGRLPERRAKDYGIRINRYIMIVVLRYRKPSYRSIRFVAKQFLQYTKVMCLVHLMY